MTPTEKLIAYMETHPFCEIKIIVKGGIPVMIEESKENIKLS